MTVDMYHCGKCNTFFRTHSELQAHERQHLSKNGNPTPGMRPSVKAELAAAQQRVKQLENDALALRRYNDSLKERNDKLARDLKMLTNAKLMEVKDFEDARAQAQMRDEQIALVEAFSDDDLEQIGATREELLERLRTIEDAPREAGTLGRYKIVPSPSAWKNISPEDMVGQRVTLTVDPGQPVTQGAMGKSQMSAGTHAGGMVADSQISAEQLKKVMGLIDEKITRSDLRRLA